MSEIGNYALMAFGIGLVIFVHELGHFLAARLCRVRVDVFSLGFGPRILGWQRGSTWYQLSLLPLGGYVRMAGEEREDGRRPAPDELQAKSVGQRFFIYSGGVLMNVAFALIVFPILLANGISMAEPVVGSTVPGSPAWHAGVPAGSRVLEVNGHPVQDFAHIPPEVALGSAEQTSLTLLEPGSSEPRRFLMKPEYSEALGIYTIGLSPAWDPSGTLEIEADSPAQRAGLQTGDRLLAVEGTPAGLSQEDALRFVMRDSDPLRLRFEHVTRDEHGQELAREERSVQIEPAASAQKTTPILGVTALVNRVVDLRATERIAHLGLEKEDRLLTVNEQPILREFDLTVALQRPSATLVIVLERRGEPRRLEFPSPKPAEALALAGDIALGPDNASNRVTIRKHSAAAEAGMLDGDRIVAVAGHPLTSFDQLQALIKDAGGGHALDVAVRRAGAGEEQERSFSIQPRESFLTYGLMLQVATYTFKTNGPAQAVSVGFASSWKWLKQSWLTLRRIMTGQVSGEKNVGGIITIGVVAHSLAAEGLARLFFFLCMLSINLAFLNVLPIPVLDGGHLFFLVIEKIKGTPVSERVLSYSQIVGIVVIVSLMVYVTFNDIQRHFFH